MAYRQRQLRDRLVFDDGIVALLDPVAREVGGAYSFASAFWQGAWMPRAHTRVH